MNPANQKLKSAIEHLNRVLQLHESLGGETYAEAIIEAEGMLDRHTIRLEGLTLQKETSE